jgi:hypothetical protein
MMKTMGGDKVFHGVFDTEEDVVALRARAWSVIQSLNEVSQHHPLLRPLTLIITRCKDKDTKRCRDRCCSSAQHCSRRMMW